MSITLVFALLIDEATLTFGVCISDSPLPSLTSWLGGSLVASLRGEELTSPGRGAEAGVPSETSGYWDLECRDGLHGASGMGVRLGFASIV